MKRLGWIIGTATVTVIVLVIELMIINKASDYETREKVVLAKVSIDEGNIITRDMLEIREIASDLVTSGTVKSIEEAEEKVSAMKIETGEIILKTKLQTGDNSVIEVSDKSNRLFSVRFEADQANGWQLEEGQLVDLICIPNGNQQGSIFTSDENSEAAADITVPSGEKAVNPIYAGEAAAVGVYEGQMANSPVATSITAASSEFAGKNTPGKVSSAGAAGSPVPVSKALEGEYSSFTEVKVLKGIRVAAIIGEDGKREDNKQWDNPQYISFEVTEKQAVFLAYVKYNGKIELAGIPKQE